MKLDGRSQERDVTNIGLQSKDEFLKLIEQIGEDYRSPSHQISRVKQDFEASNGVVMHLYLRREVREEADLRNIEIRFTDENNQIIRIIKFKNSGQFESVIEGDFIQKEVWSIYQAIGIDVDLPNPVFVTVTDMRNTANHHKFKLAKN